MIHLSQQLAKHFREVFLGGNWTCVNLKETLADINVQQANQRVQNLNTIATLTCHINYYVSAVIKVLKGGPLEAKDELSFNHAPIASQQEWERIIATTLAEAEEMARLIEQIPEEKLWENFTDAKYGNFYRNLQGIVEHTHYHLGQIALIKKMLQGTVV